MKNNNAKHWIEKLRLEPHPEGGYFRQTFRSEIVIARQALPGGFGGARAVSTAIYFLLEGVNFSAFHRLRSDEMWHFYAGSPLILEAIEPTGSRSTTLLGDDADAGKFFGNGVLEAALAIHGGGAAGGILDHGHAALALQQGAELAGAHLTGFKVIGRYKGGVVVRIDA